MCLLAKQPGLAFAEEEELLLSFRRIREPGLLAFRIREVSPQNKELP